MEWKSFFIPTLREPPKDAEEKSHILLLRGGYIRQISAGVYAFLPLAKRVILKIERIIREEMERIGAQEIYLPVLSPKMLWELSGRWKDYGDDMFRLRDRKNQDFALSPTHEEIITYIASKEIRSYRDLPQIWYQIQPKLRDEPRPRAGLLRTREFHMKDSYSLDADFGGLDISYKLHKKAYERIFSRIGFKYFIVEASGGVMGEGESAEFMVEAEAGEDRALICSKCGYSANAEIAEAVPEPEDGGDEKRIEKVHTPDVKTVEDVSSFLGVSKKRIIKSMLLIKKESVPFMVLLRGDYDISEAKLVKVFEKDIRFATPEEAVNYLNASLGFIGPYGVKNMKIFADESVRDIKDGVTGANEDNYHIKGLSVLRDIKIEKFVDVRRAKAGDLCKKCMTPLEEKKAIELGHIFKLGTKYSLPMNAKFLDKDGKEKPIVMGSYGIGVERALAAAVEVFSTNNCMKLPVSIAPFEVEVISIGNENKSSEIVKQLKEKGIEVLYDNRNVQPGVKFFDADLIGVPLRVVVGPKGLSKGTVDLKILKTEEVVELPLEEVSSKVKKLIEEEKNG